MKKLIVSSVLMLVLFGCKKESKTSSGQHQASEKISQDVPKCGNDLNPEFAVRMSKARRSRDEQEIVNRRKPKDDPDPTSTPTVIFLDADGHTVENTIWNSFNSGNPFNCLDAGLTTDQINAIIKSAAEDFSTFQVVVTTDENLYNQTPKERRVRVIVTKFDGLENIIPNSSGIAFIGSLWWKDDTPCFVFVNLLSGRTKVLANILSHEVGHTIGLDHQAEFDVEGNLIWNYHSGFFSQRWNLKWSAIMGNTFFDEHISGWMSGSTLRGLQDDLKLLGAVGAKVDELSNGFSTATPLKLTGASKPGGFDGLVQNRFDVDFYVVDSRDLKLSIIGGGNCDIKVDVYDDDQHLIAQYNDSDNLGISEKIVETTGKRIYLKVSPNSLAVSDWFSIPEYTGQYSLVVQKRKGK